MIFDCILYISDFCHLEDLIRLSTTSKELNKYLSKKIEFLLKEIPWRLSIEFIKNKCIDIHTAALSIGYINHTDIIDETCNICKNGKWVKSKCGTVCHTNYSKINSKNIKICVFNGKGINFMKSYKKYIPLSVYFNRDNIQSIDFCDNCKPGYTWYDDVVPKLFNLNPIRNHEYKELDLDKNFNHVSVYDKNINGTSINFKTLYDGYTDEHLEYIFL